MIHAQNNQFLPSRSNSQAHSSWLKLGKIRELLICWSLLTTFLVTFRSQTILILKCGLFLKKGMLHEQRMSKSMIHTVDILHLQIQMFFFTYLTKISLFHDIVLTYKLMVNFFSNRTDRMQMIRD